MLKVRIEELGRVAILRVRGSIVAGPELETFRKTVMSQLEQCSARRFSAR
jgi:hypothetical protein